MTSSITPRPCTRFPESHGDPYLGGGTLPRYYPPPDTSGGKAIAYACDCPPLP